MIYGNEQSYDDYVGPDVNEEEAIEDEIMENALRESGAILPDWEVELVEEVIDERIYASFGN